MELDFAAHRARLLARLEPDEAVLVFAQPHHRRNSNTEYRYRPSGDMFWLTGWRQPHAAALLRHGDEPFTLFVQPRDRQQEIWNGYRPGVDGAVADFGADQAFTFSELESMLPGLLKGIRTLHHDFAIDAEHDAVVVSSVNRAKRTARYSSESVPETFRALSHTLHELRLIKGADEIEMMRAAGRQSAEAHKRAMAACCPGATEREIEAVLFDVFRQGSGATGPGYTPIVAGGRNATCLHYIENDKPLVDGDLLLIDAGCEHHFYTADITRTFPVNGVFSATQRALYDHVLRAQELAIAACIPGNTFAHVHEVARDALIEGMLDLGLLEGSLAEIVEEKSYKRFYPHGTGHWLGLDVHDVGSYGRDGHSRVLEPGMVLTVEPGLYIQSDDDEASEHFKGLGIRIEDDIHVTADGPEVLTCDVPKDIDSLLQSCAIA